jgi:hypothetical protein
MFKLRIYCNDRCCEYWEDGNGTYETYDKALIACYENALAEAQELMESSNGYDWFEVNMDFEITEDYKSELLSKEEVIFPVATVYYDHAPYDRENDCHIEVITGYDIVEIKEV